MSEGKDVKARILVVDDDASMRRALQRLLSGAGYEVHCVDNGAEAVRSCVERACELVILDVMMPGMDGFATCEAIRSVDGNVAILFLSAKGDIVDKRIGYSLGADDYIAKPFSAEELVLRVGALLRGRSAEPSGTVPRSGVVRVGDLEIDILRQRVFREGRSLGLTPNEARIVSLLALHPGEAYSKSEIVRKVWGEEYVGESISIPSYIRRIREKIEPDPAEPLYLETVWGEGYRLKTY